MERQGEIFVGQVSKGMPSGSRNEMAGAFFSSILAKGLAILQGLSARKFGRLGGPIFPVKFEAVRLLHFAD
jgi:hypothetical protein